MCATQQTPDNSQTMASDVAKPFATLSASRTTCKIKTEGVSDRRPFVAQCLSSPLRRASLPMPD